MSELEAIVLRYQDGQEFTVPIELVNLLVCDHTTLVGPSEEWLGHYVSTAVNAYRAQGGDSE